jgi:hypothetical protein
LYRNNSYIAAALSLLILFTTLACRSEVLAPGEVNEGLQKYKVISGDFNHLYAETSAKRPDGSTKKQMLISINDCQILKESTLEMLGFFSSGIAFYVFNNLTDAQREKYDAITINIVINGVDNKKEYSFEELAFVEMYDWETYPYWDNFVTKDFEAMYYNHQDFSVTSELDFPAYVNLLSQAYEDDDISSIEMVGYTFFKDMQRDVLHLWYVIVYQNAQSRRHSLFFLVNDNNFLLDGIQL